MSESGLQLLFRRHCLFLLLCMATSSPPDDSIKCLSKTSNCTITNSYGEFPDRTICRAAEVVYPTSEEELVAAVANASMNQRKAKAATRYSHSIPKLSCPGGDDGILISTRYLNRIVAVDGAAMLMTVESGVTLREVIDAAAKEKMALPYTPYWWGITVGGLIATGAHGSSLWGKGSSVHDYVESIHIVTPASPAEGYAKLRELAGGDTEMNAARVSLGVLGIISRVTLKLLFKRSITLLSSNDLDLSEKAAIFGNQHEFADMTWYPSQQKVIYRVDDRVSSNATGNGHNNFMNFRSTTALTLAIVRSTEESQEATGNARGKCSSARITTSTLMSNAFGLTNDGLNFISYPVVGPQNRIQASGGCLDSLEDSGITACPWDHRTKGLFFHQTTFTIGLASVKSFIQDVKRLRDLEPRAFCGVELYNGILMRYVKASAAYLGKQEDGVDFDITYYRSKDPMAPRLFEDILEEVEQIALFKYGGLPHWGKNRNLAFDGVINKYQKRGDFLKVKQMFDPLGLFSNEWTDQVLGIKGKPSIVVEGCALEGLCICSEDLHCAPKKGYYCRPGKVYEDARVCTPLARSV